MERQTHYYGSSTLAILLQQEGKSEQQQNKHDKTKHILKAPKTYFSYLTGSVSVLCCVIFSLSSLN